MPQPSSDNPVQCTLQGMLMPPLDGMELLARLRADRRTSTVPVILLSARAGEEAKVEGLDAGADAELAVIKAVALLALP